MYTPFMSRSLSFARDTSCVDAFLLYPLLRGLVPTDGFEFKIVAKDIDTLNREAADGIHDVTALSFHAYAHLGRGYVMLSAAATVGDGYGPLIVSRRSLTSVDLEECTVAIPGERTTAALALRLFCPGVKTRVLDADRIATEVAKGNLDAGLLIHEDKASYGDLNLRRVVDLGEWWRMETGLPLPLGGYAVRASLEPPARAAVCEILRSSVRYALDHRREALEFAHQASRGLDLERVSRFIGLYVSSSSIDLGERAEQGAELLFRLGHEKGILPELVTPHFAD